MALDGICKPIGKPYHILIFTPRIFLTEVDSFNSNVGYLESHNNLDLEIMLNAPTQTDLIVSTMNQLALVLNELKAINGAHARLK